MIINIIVTVALILLFFFFFYHSRFYAHKMKILEWYQEDIQLIGRLSSDDIESPNFRLSSQLVFPLISDGRYRDASPISDRSKDYCSINFLTHKKLLYSNFSAFKFWIKPETHEQWRQRIWNNPALFSSDYYPFTFEFTPIANFYYHRNQTNRPASIDQDW